jgi:hypothetical protein
LISQQAEVLLFLLLTVLAIKIHIKIEKTSIPKEHPKLQNQKCCWLGFIEPVYGRYWKV